jgi:hypothetical protein
VADDVVNGLIAEIERRVKRLSPHHHAAFYADVSALSTSIGELRRIARNRLSRTE